jgi:serine/threonine protein kinase
MYKNAVIDLAAGAAFAGHRIESVVGRGGMGVVYLAVHERLKQRRALKVIAPEYCRDEQFRRRFEREWEVAAAIDHPHVIPIYDAGEDQEQLYIAMRYIDGTDMRSLIAAERRLDPPYVAGIVGQIASALDAAHERGLVHRDVKPANILIADTPDGAFAYLTDFGLTKGVSAETSGLTKTGVVVGTLDYIAPEQLDGVATARSDIYALGCLTYHALSGQVPYPQPTAPAKMWAHIHAPPPHLSVGLPAMSDAVARAMAKNPNDRFPSAGDFAGALQAAVEGRELPVTESEPPEIGEPTVSEERRVLDDIRLAVPAGTPMTAAGDRQSPPPPPAAKPRPTSRRPIAAAIALAIVLVGGVAAAIVSSGGGSEKHAAKRVAPKPAAKVVKLEPQQSPPIPKPHEGLPAAAKRMAAANPSLGSGDASYESYGSGGIIQFAGPKTYAMALDRNHRWVPSDKKPFDAYTLGHKRLDFSEADSVAKRFVMSVRDRQCQTFWDVAATKTDNVKKECHLWIDGAYAPARADFRKARRVDVMRLGGTADLAFYGVRAGRSYRTLTLEPGNGGNSIVDSMSPVEGVRVPAKS